MDRRFETYYFEEALELSTGCVVNLFFDPLDTSSTGEPAEMRKSQRFGVETLGG